MILYWLAILHKLSKIVDCRKHFYCWKCCSETTAQQLTRCHPAGNPFSTHEHHTDHNWSRFSGSNNNFKIIKRSSLNWVCQGTPPSPLWQLVQATSIGAIAKLSTSAASHIGNCNSTLYTASYIYKLCALLYNLWCWLHAILTTGVN